VALRRPQDSPEVYIPATTPATIQLNTAVEVIIRLQRIQMLCPCFVNTKCISHCSFLADEVVSHSVDIFTKL